MAGDIDKLKKSAGETLRKIEGTVTEKTVSDDSKAWAAFGYLLVVLIPVVVLLTDKKKDRFVAFHAYQSLVLFVVSIGYYIVLAIAHIILGIISGLVALLLLPFYFVPMLVFLLMAYNAFMGKLFELPFIGGIARKAASG